MPWRSDNLSEPRKSNRGDLTTGTALPCKAPVENPAWHALAKRLWKGLVNSGQAEFFQASDWAFAYHMMEEISEYKRSTRRSGQMLAVINDALGRLMMTEGDRRRRRIELHAPNTDEGPTAGVVALEEYRKGLKVS